MRLVQVGHHQLAAQHQGEDVMLQVEAILLRLIVGQQLLIVSAGRSSMQGQRVLTYWPARYAWYLCPFSKV